MFEAVVYELREQLRVAEERNVQPSAALVDSHTLQSSPESGTRAGSDGVKVYPSTGAADAGVQIPRARATLPLSVWSYRPHFRPLRHRLSASTYRQEMQKRVQIWEDITGTAIAA